MKPSEAEMVELAALLAAGALDEATASAARWRLDTAGDAVRAEAAALEETAAMLAESVEPVAPPNKLKARLLDRVEKTPQQRPGSLLDEAGVRILRSAEIPWQERPTPGVAVKPLYVDKQSGRVTSLVRFDPGVVYPAHEHAADEELLVLSGDLEIQGRVMGPGDYCHGVAGSQHSKGLTRGGALLLVRNSMADRFLA